MTKLIDTNASNAKTKTNLLAALKAKLLAMNIENDDQKCQMLANILKMQKQQINLLITGATGSGKSSTINALFKTNVAKIGMGSDPETQHIQQYQLDNLIIWDSPGFGDGIKEDERHAKGITTLLNQTNDAGECKIDLVLVLLDGGSRDYGTTYKLLEKVILPHLYNSHERILIAINQADMALNGRGWDKESNRPTPALIKQLEDKVNSTQLRIKENTGVDVKPIYYCAGYQDEDECQQPYNLAKLLNFIVERIPKDKRYKIADNMTTDQALYATNDDIIDYTDKTKHSIADSLMEVVDGIVDIAEDLVSAVADTVSSVVNTAVDIGKSIISTGASFIRSVFSWF